MAPRECRQGALVGAPRRAICALPFFALPAPLHSAAENRGYLLCDGEWYARTRGRDVDADAQLAVVKQYASNALLWFDLSCHGTTAARQQRYEYRPRPTLRPIVFFALVFARKMTPHRLTLFLKFSQFRQLPLYAAHGTAPS